MTDRLDWRGRSLAHRRRGDGPAVVLCHGTPFSSWIWDGVADALSDRFTVHQWDLPGFGESSQHAEHPVDLDTHAEALAALVEHWGLDRPHVVAHDIGGTAAVRAHLVHGVDVASLVLVDTVVVPPAGSPFFRWVREHPTALDTLPPAMHAALLREYLSGAAAQPLDEATIDRLIVPWRGAEGQAAFSRQIAQFDEAVLADTERRLDALTMPTRVVWGQDDAWLPISTGRRLAAAIPDATWREIPGAGHLVQLDRPDALLREITAWLDEQPA